MTDCKHDLRHSSHGDDYVYCTICHKEWKPASIRVQVDTGNCGKSGSTDYTCICSSNHDCVH